MVGCADLNWRLPLFLRGVCAFSVRVSSFFCCVKVGLTCPVSALRRWRPARRPSHLTESPSQQRADFTRVSCDVSCSAFHHARPSTGNHSSRALQHPSILPALADSHHGTPACLSSSLLPACLSSSPSFLRRCPCFASSHLHVSGPASVYPCTQFFLAKPFLILSHQSGASHVVAPPSSRLHTQPGNTTTPQRTALNTHPSSPLPLSPSSPLLPPLKKK